VRFSRTEYLCQQCASTILITNMLLIGTWLVHIGGSARRETWSRGNLHGDYFSHSGGSHFTRKCYTQIEPFSRIVNFLKDKAQRSAYNWPMLVEKHQLTRHGSSLVQAESRPTQLWRSLFWSLLTAYGPNGLLFSEAYPSSKTISEQDVDHETAFISSIEGCVGYEYSDPNGT